ncbi:unnamed protein product [Cuscuta epithymum]|uniref:F-box domain-containing protein n=1 Tax=Cuscuta epithymum TaxID=186058 RepID=A0AAV0EZD9_9ASTE|nr:unnamed protein product [Cuscuta epithymum]CAH9128636.1 unnamed protein product [Cuscuta epithymum]
MNKIGRSENELSDFFSMLPESLTHHILSFLPFKDIVRTSVLSKMWSRIWLNYPNIDLLLHEEAYMDTLHRRSFLDHIKLIMDQCILRKPCIQKLQLNVFAGNLEELAPIMDQWFRAAIERNVSELLIEMNFGATTYYNIPKEVFVSNSLKVLELQGCKFEDSFSCTSLPHLQKLRTLRCLFASENVLSNILCGCPELESLEALVSEGMSSFLSVSCKPRLKYFDITCLNELKRIEIFVPSLETLKCSYVYSCSINMASCTLLKHLELNRVTLSSDYVPIQYLLSNLPHIKELHLSNCKSDDKIQISSSCLKRLVMTEYENFPGAELDIPNLLSLDIFLGECNSTNRFSSWNVPKVEEIHMLLSVKSFQSACRGGLKGFLMQLQHYEDVKLIIQCRGKQDLIIHEKLHAVSFSSLNKFLKKAKAEYVVISSRRDDSFLANMLVSNDDVSLSMICSSRRSIELLHKKLSKSSTLKYWYKEFQLVSMEEIEHEVDSDWKPFMKTHSTGYHTARIILIKKSMMDMIHSMNVSCV